MYCEYCGAEIPDDSIFCEKCGKKIKKLNLDEKTSFFNSFTLSLIAFFLGIIGQVFLYFQKSIFLGLLFFSFAIIVFIIADLKNRNKYIVFDNINKKTEIILFGIIFLIGVFFRVYKINIMPPDFFADEGENGLNALYIMTGKIMKDIIAFPIQGNRLPVYVVGITHTPAMYLYFIAAFFKLFGVGTLQVRAVSIFLGVLTIPVVYFMLRYFFGVKMALIGEFLFAVMRWHINYSRIGWNAIFAVLIMAFIIYFLYRAYKKRKWSDFILLGIVTGLSQYTYQPSRLLPVVFIILLIYILFKDIKFYLEYKKILLSIILAFIIFLPMGNYIKNHFNEYTARFRNTTILNKQFVKNYFFWVGAPRQIDLYKKNFKNTFLMFNYKGDHIARHNIPNKPMLDFFTGIFFVLGFGYTLYRIFSPLYFLLFTSFIVMLHASILTVGTPHATRTINVIPIVIVFATIFIYKTYNYFINTYGKEKQKIFFIPLIFLLIIIGYNNYDLYFNKHYNCKEIGTAFSPEEYNMAMDLRKNQNLEGIVLLRYYLLRSFYFTIYPYHNFEIFKPYESIPIRPKVKKDYMFLLIREYLPIVPSLKYIYPHGEYSEYRPKQDPSNVLYFRYKVKYKDIINYLDKKENHGITGYYYKNLNWQGSPAITLKEPFLLLAHYYKPIEPPYSMKWAGKIKIDKDGIYSFILKSNGEYSDFFIDGKKLITITARYSGPMQTKRANIKLKKGFHKVVVRYKDRKEHVGIEWWWRKPGTNKDELVPYFVLYPEK